MAVRNLLIAGADFNHIQILASEYGIDYRQIAIEIIKNDEIKDKEGVDAAINTQVALL